MPDYDRLVDDARRARKNALAPYSTFRVGAALVSRRGEVYTGCNIESAAYGLTMCAERVALFTALSAGVREFEGLAVVADTPTPTPPCGACRQLLWEHCGDIWVILANAADITGRHTMRELLPVPFDGRLLR